jgi:hypothetical protein
MVKFNSQHCNNIEAIVESIKKDNKRTLKSDLVSVFTEKFPDTNYTYLQLYNLYNKRKATNKVSLILSYSNQNKRSEIFLICR